jgi:hypothetical protein
MSSYANYAPSTQGGLLFDQGLSNLVDLGNKYEDNEVIGGMVSGSMIDSFRDQMATGSALQYSTSMSSHLANIQQGLEENRTANTLRIMGNEGRIARDLIGAQGEQQRMGLRETGSQQRMNIGAQGAQDRMNIGATGTQQRLNIGAQGTQDRLSLGVKGSEDRKSLRTAGAEERLNIGKRYTEERGMRADARGAIRSLGSRFFG